MIMACFLFFFLGIKQNHGTDVNDETRADKNQRLQLPHIHILGGKGKKQIKRAEILKSETLSLFEAFTKFSVHKMNGLSEMVDYLSIIAHLNCMLKAFSIKKTIASQ